MVIEADMGDSVQLQPFVLEVWSEDVEGDPRIRVYRATLLCPRVTEEKAGLLEVGEWSEGFGSVDALRGFLKGLEVLFYSFGYSAPLLGWEIPHSWGPKRMRWIIEKVPGYGRREDLDEAGNVIEI